MELKFKCPECSGNKVIKQCQTFKYFPITKIDDDGEFGDIELDYANAYESDLDPIGFFCDNCRYEIKNECDENVWDESELVEWVKENC